MSASPPRIVVTAAVIERDRSFFITRRPRGTHLEGLWEFPGGKCADGESLADCLVREIKEELEVDVRVGQEVYGTAHAYPERVVELHFFRCELLGDPRPALGQEMRWVPAEALGSFDFPPADAELIQMLSDGRI